VCASRQLAILRVRKYALECLSVRKLKLRRAPPPLVRHELLIGFRVVMLTSSASEPPTIVGSRFIRRGAALAICTALRDSTGIVAGEDLIWALASLPAFLRFFKDQLS
jgi:hypothetical protein